MKLAVIGSRGFADAALLAATLGKVKTPITCLVSGGATGADKLGEAWARERGVPTEIFLPDYKEHGGKRAPLIRNEQIAQAADCVLAFWDGMSTGTAHAIGCFKRLGKKAHVITVPVAPVERTPPPAVPNLTLSCYASITNPRDLPEGYPDYEALEQLIEGLPAPVRREAIACGCLVIELEDSFGSVVVFEVLRWVELSSQLHLRFEYATPGVSIYEFWYMPVEEHCSGRKFK